MKNITLESAAIKAIRQYILATGYDVQGWSTGGQPSSDDRAAITAMIESASVASISDDDIYDAAQAAFDCTGTVPSIQDVAAAAIRAQGEGEAAQAGYDLDGYSSEINFRG